MAEMITPTCSELLLSSLRKEADPDHWQIDQRPVHSEIQKWEPRRQMRCLVEGDVVQELSTGCSANPSVTLNKGVGGARGCICSERLIDDRISR